MFQIPKTEVFSMNDIDLVTCLKSNIGLTLEQIKILFKENIDGPSFLLLRKKELSYLKILDKYFQICMLFPYGRFVDEFI